VPDLFTAFQSDPLSQREADFKIVSPAHISGTAFRLTLIGELKITDELKFTRGPDFQPKATKIEARLG